MKCDNPKPAVTAVMALLLALSFLPVYAADERETERNEMVDKIAGYTAKTSKYIGKHKFSGNVLQAMREVPRHRFVPDNLQASAYANRPLPIGYGQTISQPYIVALMTELLQPESSDRMLEIGTGSGYQAAVLSRIVDEVYSIEIIEPLSRRSTALLEDLDYDNVYTRVADGYYGWEEHAPFDGIIVTAAISHIPPPLVSQLKPGGTMVIPVGTRFQVQQLTLVSKDSDGGISTRQVLPVRFVPFTGDH